MPVIVFIWFKFARLVSVYFCEYAFTFFLYLFNDVSLPIANWVYVVNFFVYVPLLIKFKQELCQKTRFKGFR
jgi:hypothetical protein